MTFLCLLYLLASLPAAQILGANSVQISSWFWALGLGIGLSGLILSWKFKYPVATSWSTAGLALIIATGSGYSLHKAIGAFLLCGVLTAVLGFLGIFEKVLNTISQSLTSAMLAGVLLKFGVALFTSLQEAWAFILCLLVGYVLVKRFSPRYSIVLTSPRELWEFNRNFTPHQYLNNEETIVNALHIDYRNIQDVLFKILHKIEFEKGYIELDKYRFTYRNNAKPGIFFLPTTIPTNMKLSRIERGFRENKSMSTSLYEVQNYIYMGDVLHKFNPNQQYRENVPFSEGSKENRIKRHEMINEISLIPKIIAIEELIND